MIQMRVWGNNFLCPCGCGVLFVVHPQVEGYVVSVVHDEDCPYCEEEESDVPR